MTLEVRRIVTGHDAAFVLMDAEPAEAGGQALTTHSCVNRGHLSDPCAGDRQEPVLCAALG
jgi:hypothetical protein